MRNIWVIFRKEINSYFVSPVAYTVLDDIRDHLRVFLLELARLLRVHGHPIPNARPKLPDERE